MSTDRLSTTFAALADPTRRAILARLVSGTASVTELGEPFQMSPRHLQASQSARARRSDCARAPGAMAPPRLKGGPLKEVADWVEHYRRFWEQSFDRLDDYLHEVQSKEKKHGRKK